MEAKGICAGFSALASVAMPIAVITAPPVKLACAEKHIRASRAKKSVRLFCWGLY
jgi:hypothetical protein